MDRVRRETVTDWARGAVQAQRRVRGPGLVRHLEADLDLVLPEEMVADRGWGAVQDRGRRAAMTMEMGMIVMARATAELDQERARGQKVADVLSNQLPSGAFDTACLRSCQFSGNEK